MIKICKKCYGKSIQKFGKTDGRQRYKCMICGYIFRSPRRISASGTKKNQDLFLEYSIHKQTLSELADTEKVSIKTIHRKLNKEFILKIESSKEQNNIRLNPNLSKYTSSVLILDATFFGRKGSDNQWGLLVAIDGITGDILASKHILQETKGDYEILLHYLFHAGYPPPHFAVIDGRNGVDTYHMEILFEYSCATLPGT